MLSRLFAKPLTRTICIGFFVGICLFFVGTIVVSAQVTPNSDYQVVQCTGEECSSGLLKWLLDFVIVVFGSLVGLFGSAFDWFIGNFIIDFGLHYQSSNFGAVIDGVWSTVRDIFNLTFIFGLIYIGFQIILGTNDSQAKKTIPMLILAALLVNFSLFITKFIVDFSNIAAVEVYQLFESSANAYGSSVGGYGGASISQAFMNALGISSLFGQLPAGAELLYIFGMLIVFLVLIYVFLAGAILIAIRFAMLSLYLVFSPVMFIGWVFPGFNKYQQQFWSGFLGQAFFAPAFLFMLYLSYQIVSTFSGDTHTNFNTLTVSNGSTVTSGFLAVMPLFLMTVVFLLASMAVAKGMSRQGSEYAVKGVDWMYKKGMGAVKGAGQAVSYVPRAGARYGVNKTGEWSEKKLNSLQARDGKLGKLLSTNAVDKALRGGTTKMQKAEMGTGTTNKAEKEYRAITTNRNAGLQEKKSREAAIATAAANFAELDALRNKPNRTNNETNRLISLETEAAQAQNYINQLDKGEIEKLDKTTRKAYATKFNADQMKHILDSEKITNDEKESIIEARREKIRNNTTSPGNIMKLTRDELETLGFDWMTNNVQNLTHSQFDDYIKNNKKLTPELVNSFKSVRESKILQSIEDGSAGGLLTELKKKPKEFAQLPKQVFTDRRYVNIIPYLTVGVLEQIAHERILDQNQRFAIKGFLTHGGRGSTPTEVIAYLSSDKGKEYYGP